MKIILSLLFERIFTIYYYVMLVTGRLLPPLLPTLPRLEVTPLSAFICDKSVLIRLNQKRDPISPSTWNNVNCAIITLIEKKMCLSLEKASLTPGNPTERGSRKRRSMLLQRRNQQMGFSRHSGKAPFVVVLKEYQFLAQNKCCALDRPTSIDPQA